MKTNKVFKTLMFAVCASGIVGNSANALVLLAPFKKTVAGATSGAITGLATAHAPACAASVANIMLKRSGKSFDILIKKLAGDKEWLEKTLQIGTLGCAKALDWLGEQTAWENLHPFFKGLSFTIALVGSWWGADFAIEKTDLPIFAKENQKGVIYNLSKAATAFGMLAFATHPDFEIRNRVQSTENKSTESE